MSHVVKLKAMFRSLPTLQKVCQQKQIPIEVAPVGQTLTRRLYTTEVRGRAAFNLPEWKFPVVVEESGECKADNYGGSWGKQEHLDDLTKDYSRALVTDQLQNQGMRLDQEETLEDGTLELQFVS